jgi:ectoine hydroxylase-related dioxygenase (phytanoyl-CoA dioxygenase family)
MEYKKIIATTMQRCPIVLKIGQSDKVIKTLKRLNIYNPIFSTDPLIMLHSDFVQEKNYAPFHQDWRSIQGSLNNIVIWVPLVDVKKNMNSIEYIESSHLNGLAPTIKDKWFRKIKKIKTTTKDIKSINISKGDAFIFSSFLIHRSGINTSNFIRVSLQYRYNDLEDSYFINNGYPYPYEYAKPNDKLIIKKLPSKKQIRKKFKL